MGLIDKIFGTYSERELKKIEPIKQRVLELEATYQPMTDSELRGQTEILKNRLANGETLDDIMADALAAVREAAYRVLGKKAFPVQIIGAIVLHQGRIAEMKTGEGKTLTACLASYLNALSGNGVHVVTVNDYLAKFQSEEMGRVYRFLGLSIGCILHHLNNDERREAYACDITYGTNNEFGFDYLRDNMVVRAEDRVQRGQPFAIVDEVDSILIDEARTPLIISGRGDKSSDMYEKVDKFAKRLTKDVVVETETKQDNDAIFDGDYIVDEKAHTATLTAKGIQKAEEYFGVENLSDMENTTLLHHINQAIHANGVKKRDIDYVVKDGEVIIVDEFTGRLMQGRRYSDGLHQAIEAKEGVKVAHESKTIATITFQNYFRLYKKLSGMTGTAQTEENEFREIYNLDVIVIPTNRPMIRIDRSDAIYKTEKAKFLAVINEIVRAHEKGQPVLVGTVSIEKSELLSALLSRRGIKHEVLNAKHHEREAAIVAQAGRFGSVTIATNMAGRGTDIMLGGNAEFLAKAELIKMGFDDTQIYDITGFGELTDEALIEAREQYHEILDKFSAEVKEKAEAVKAAGGLYIIGTERHESRRIDNQLRGRSGRQGDEGESKFFLSLEDDLMRLFGGDRINMIMESLNVPEDMPIEAKMLTSVIESSQKKVEARNFNIRKNVLNYDDVMNQQRSIIYGQRSMVLDGGDVKSYILKMIRDYITETANTYLAGDDESLWNFDGLREQFKGLFPIPDNYEYTTAQLNKIGRKDIIEDTVKLAYEHYEKKEVRLTSPIMRELERVVLLKQVDTKWMQHIDDMAELKRGIALRSYSQHDPVVEYRFEGFNMFDEMVSAICADTVKILFVAELQPARPLQREQVLKAEDTGSDGTVSATRKTGKKVGVNDPCPCGSGKKYKKCCGR